MVKELLKIKSVDTAAGTSFGDLYITLRDKENRVYTDEEVLRLPLIDKMHQHAAEWKIRNESSQRLLQHLKRKSNPLKILEVGCGNGWLSARLAGVKDSVVTGIDVNEPELAQARRLFSDKINLQFQQCSLENIYGETFDIIVFAASVQYFRFLPETLKEALKRLKAGGEIHILDTKFYSATEVIAARRRSADYFQKQGAFEMHQYYFHHELSALNSFDHSILFNPKALKNRFLSRNPFYWICLYKK